VTAIEMSRSINQVVGHQSDQRTARWIFVTVVTVVTVVAVGENG